MRNKALESHSPIEVLASARALPFLADQSYNVCFGTDQAPYMNITDVTPLRDGDVLNMGSDLSLEIMDTPGHMRDHISIIDLSNRNIFIGDAFGMKWIDDFNVCNANSPFWNEAAFFASIDRLKTLDYTSLSLAHFGYLAGDEAKDFPDESLAMYRRWMKIFAKNTERIEDITFLAELMWDQIYTLTPDLIKPLLLPGLEGAVELAAGAYQARHRGRATD